ncbi:nitrous oxidase accessory protein [Tistlia consotensis]|uniref:Nitrous oxidase accessory protein n=1 Tax=Tistlia consotensis USBA 355 TaxID=560819 RepID=A0A1Y6BV00_9PROT|nr:nitrous oxide reductase family maturation protein NosD [Tistlia consotensis]SMF21614.1 nitrous oxidase accessory protein [Tistlia consotensis USBA 355]SNR46732.1 nitrous oxidase accessory protein [Tistlia consotensis]
MARLRPGPVARLIGGLLLAAVASATAAAAELRPAPGDDLQAVLAAAAPGDVVRLGAGRYRGPVTIDRPLALAGVEGTLLEGDGKGSVITITASDVTVTGLTITGSGLDLPAMDSAVLVRRSARHAVIRGNRLENNLFGVYLHGAAGSLVVDNTIVGRRDLRLSEAGNGVSIWNAPGAEVVGNDIRYGRDGIFVTTSKRNVFRDNRFADLRFAIHYMYTQDSRIVGNRSHGNHAAWALMYSDRLEIRDNVSEGDRDHGLLMNYVNDSTVTGNVVLNSAGKCLFIYNAHRNRIEGNRFQGCPIGIHFTAGSERNAVSGNAFVGNRTQVKYVGTRTVEWSHDGRGNYWSDNAAFDLNGDGIADRAYRPNDIADDILWRYPLAKLLLNSPAITALRFAQSRLPALLPGGVVDSAPLMAPPATGGPHS